MSETQIVESEKTATESNTNITTQQPSITAKWRKEVSAANSAWRTRASLMISQDLLVLGAVESNPHLSHDFHEIAKLPEAQTQLYICDTNTLTWSSANLNGKGPINSPFYHAEASQQNDKIFTIYPTPMYKEKIARVVKSYQAVCIDLKDYTCFFTLYFLKKSDSELSVKEGEFFVVLDESSTEWVGGRTEQGAAGIIPKSAIAFADVPFAHPTRYDNIKQLCLYVCLDWN